MRIAYIKSGDVVSALQRLAAGEHAASDDGGPDGFLGDLLRSTRGDTFLLLGVATAVTHNAVDTDSRKLRAVTLSLRRRFGRLRIAARLLVELIRFRPDRVICGKCGLPLWISFLVARLRGVPLFHSRHNWLEERGPIARLATAIDNRIVRRADAVLCHGPYLRDRLTALGVDAHRTFEFDSGNEALVAGAATFAVSADRIGETECVLFVGRVVRQKGVFDLLEACAGLWADGMALELVYVGTGPDLEQLRAEATARGLDGCVRFTGRIPHADVGGLMTDSRVVVTPTRKRFPEGRCMTAMEALAVGVPVIAPETGPFPYLVRHGENGLLYPPDSVDGLRACIHRVLVDEVLSRRLADGARESGRALLTPGVTFSEAFGRAMALTAS